jgi:hypothetical protein
MFVDSERRRINAWRERGYAAGEKGREPRPPQEVSEEERAAYLAGHRLGVAARKRREAAAE